MVLLLDNYDSFTYNLVQYLGELGTEVTVIRNDAEDVETLLGREPKAIVLSPGPGRPENAGVMNTLIEAAKETIPMLGVCLGHQAIAQVFGAQITYAPTIMHGKTSEIFHDESILFKRIPSPFTATRYHSLIVDPTTLPKELKVTAHADRDVVMALEHRDHKLYGVQFHPESILTSHGKTILKNFLDSL